LGASRAQISVAARDRGALSRYAVEQRLVRTRRRALVWLLASVVAVLGTDDARPAARHHVPTHLKYAPAHRNKAAEARHHKRGSERAKRFARLRQGKWHHIARKTLPRVARPFDECSVPYRPISLR
jgi:hypothetical protein